MRKLITWTILGILYLSSTQQALAFFQTPPPPDTIYKAINVSAPAGKTYCLDTSDFPGNLLSMSNICSPLSGTFVNFILQPDDYCLLYEALEIGIEPACIEYCDDSGICDTTIIFVNVVHDSISTLPPVAVDDSTTTFQSLPIVFNILENDVIPNDIYTSLRIIQYPMNGQASLDDIYIHYTPDDEFCGAKDTIVYEVCNIAECDTASLVVEVEACVSYDDILVYEGFSPNMDQTNDYWRILGLEDFPNHHIYVFNRWGNMVFEKEQYQNDWDGQWEGDYLPSGTYFYIIDDGEGKKHTGYVVISY